MQALFLFLFFLRLFLLICANYCIILYISSLARGCSILNRSSGWYIISPDVPVLYLFEARPTFTFFFSLPLQPVKAACTIYKYSFISPSSLDPFFFLFFQIHLSIYTYSYIYIRNNGSLRRDWSWGYVFWLWIQHILLPVPMRWPVSGLCRQAHGWFGRYAHRRVP